MTNERMRFLRDVITCVAEDGGFNAWRSAGGYKPEISVTLYDQEADEGAYFAFGIHQAEKGIERILGKDRFAINSTLHEIIRVANDKNDAGMIDAEIADCILQAAWFGEIVYG